MKNTINYRKNTVCDNLSRSEFAYFFPMYIWSMLLLTIGFIISFGLMLLYERTSFTESRSVIIKIFKEQPIRRYKVVKRQVVKTESVRFVERKVKTVIPVKKPKWTYFIRGANKSHWLYPHTKEKNFQGIVGKATYYKDETYQNSHTSTNEVFLENELTAASPYLPLPSVVRVTNIKNGRQIVVVVNDRGITNKRFKKKPAHMQRHIDLTIAAAKKLDTNFEKLGVVDVKIELLEKETIKLKNSIKEKYKIIYFNA